MKKKGIDQKIETAFTMILKPLGRTGAGGAKNTPKRIAKMYEEIFYGMDMDPQELLKVSY